MALGSAKASKRAARAVVGVDGAPLYADIRDGIRTEAAKHGIAEYLGAGVGVGATIAGQIHLGGHDAPFARGAPFGMDNERVTFVMADDAFLAGPHQLDRATGLPCGQRQHDLDGDILTTAEGATHGGVAHDDLILWEAQGMSDLDAFFV
jgi:hypothetical protein